ncbi:CIC11C00000004494 [Sungouiella intermedia]|uniref:CIC11C00000004494 n=1 Tax=Sungouiella intermedia TaxID=45354 RepID=A0A1L0DYT8_9ASCO|nr:CIC11C00000004494 [[Candida] intermedia]
MDPLNFPPNILANKQKLQRLQDVMSLALGVGAGVLCLESFNGFFFFLVTFSLSNLSFFYFVVRGSQRASFKIRGKRSSLTVLVPVWLATS